MIRRKVGDQFFLITQNDHANLSGRIAERFGNERFDRPEPYAETIAAISMHDCGWPLQDECPSLSKAGLPVDVFETPLEHALRVWTAAADRAEGHAAYTALLVSLHVLGLSGIAASHEHSRQEVFELNRFQHREIERQEALRRKLKLPTDRPTRMGLAVDDGGPGEERLKRNHGIVQVHDRLSLALCCSDLPFAEIENVVERMGKRPITLRLTRRGALVKVDPWLFDGECLVLSVAYRAVPARSYASEGEFREVYDAAPRGELEVELRRQV
jgi:hypothetical protein